MDITNEERWLSRRKLFFFSSQPGDLEWTANCSSVIVQYLKYIDYYSSGSKRTNETMRDTWQSLRNVWNLILSAPKPHTDFQREVTLEKSRTFSPISKCLMSSSDWTQLMYWHSSKNFSNHRTGQGKLSVIWSVFEVSSELFCLWPLFGLLDVRSRSA